MSASILSILHSLKSFFILRGNSNLVQKTSKGETSEYELRQEEYELRQEEYEDLQEEYHKDNIAHAKEEMINYYKETGRKAHIFDKVPRNIAWSIASHDIETFLEKMQYCNGSITISYAQGKPTHTTCQFKTQNNKDNIKYDIEKLRKEISEGFVTYMKLNSGTSVIYGEQHFTYKDKSRNRNSQDLEGIF